MRRERVLVGLSAPAGAIGHDQMPRLDLRLVRHQLVVPGEAIDVDLHDSQVGHRGGEMRVYHGAQVTVEIVRRDVDLVRLGEGVSIPVTFIVVPPPCGAARAPAVCGRRL